MSRLLIYDFNDYKPHFGEDQHEKERQMWKAIGGSFPRLNVYVVMIFQKIEVCNEK